MADNFDSIGGAIKTANDWALQAYQVNNQKAQTQAYLQQVEAQKKALQQKVAERMGAQIQQIHAAPGGPGGKYRKGQIAALMEEAKAMGIQLSPQTLATIEDPETGEAVAQAFKSLVGDPNFDAGAFLTQMSGKDLFKEVSDYNQKKIQQQTLEKFGSNPLDDLIKKGLSEGQQLGPKMTQFVAAGDPRMKGLIARDPEFLREVQEFQGKLAGQIQQGAALKQRGDVAEIQNKELSRARTISDAAAKYETARFFPEAKELVAQVESGDPEIANPAANRLQRMNVQAAGMQKEEQKREDKIKTKDQFESDLASRVDAKAKEFRPLLAPFEEVKSLDGLKGRVVDEALINNFIQALENKASVMRKGEPEFYAESLKWVDQAKQFINSRFRNGSRINDEMVNGLRNYFLRVESTAKNGYRNSLKNDWDRSQSKIKENPLVKIENIFPPEERKLLSGGKIKQVQFDRPELTKAKPILKEQAAPAAQSTLPPQLKDAAKKFMDSKGRDWVRQQAELVLKRPLQPSELKELGL